MSLDAKLATFDQHADQAVTELIEWLTADRAALIALAKGRHVEGHYRYADKLMYEYSRDELRAEASQELGDAINYLARAIHLHSI